MRTFCRSSIGTKLPFAASIASSTRGSGVLPPCIPRARAASREISSASTRRLLLTRLRESSGATVRTRNVTLPMPLITGLAPIDL